MIDLNVLLIEDSESDTAMLVRQLGKAGYVVNERRIETQEEMKLALDEKDWDIILADNQLPEFDAQSALLTLQESGLDIPFIVVSGTIDEETAVDIMKSGACDYLLKSNLSRLGPAVDRELSEAEVRRGRKQKEDLLNLQSAALNAAANAIVITSKDGTIEWANTAFATLTGYSLAETIGKNPRDIVRSGKHDESFYKHMWDTILAGEVWHGEMINQRKNRELYFEEQTITPVRNQNGQITQFIGIKQDITIRKQLENAVQQLADAFLNCTPGIAMSNPVTNRIIICNPAFAELHGSSIENMVDQPILNLYAASDHETIKSNNATADRDGQIRYETYMNRVDGSILPIQTDLVSVRDAHGTPLYRIATVQDISKRKQAEQDLLQEIEASQQRAHELEMITMVSSSMRRAQTRTELVNVILQNLANLLHTQFATLAFLEKSTLLFENAVGYCNAWQQQLVPVQSNFFAEVIQTKKPLVINLIDIHLRSILPDWIRENCSSTGALMIYPLLSGQASVGVIVLGLKHMEQLTPGQINLVAAVAEMAGNAINRMLSTEQLEIMVERRARELEHIYKITSAASKPLGIRQALQQALNLTLIAVNAQMGGIYLLSEIDGQPEQVIYLGAGLENPEIIERSFPQKIIDEVIRNKQTVLVTEKEIDAQDRLNSVQYIPGSYVGLPMRIQDRVTGILLIHKPVNERIIVEELTLLSFIADHLALIIENTRLYKKAEQSAVLEERSRLARELHDSVTQSLYSANLYVAGAQRYIALGKSGEVDNYLSQIGQLTQQALRDMRLLVYELRTFELSQDDLLGALQNRLDAVERRLAIQVNLQTNGISLLPPQIEENLYRIAIEVLNNSLKHAHATELEIKLNQTVNQIELIIEDNGRGFDPSSAARQGGMGLITMRERTEMMGGVFQIHSKPRDGTRVIVNIPLTANFDSTQGRQD